LRPYAINILRKPPVVHFHLKAAHALQGAADIPWWWKLVM